MRVMLATLLFACVWGVSHALVEDIYELEACSPAMTPILNITSNRNPWVVGQPGSIRVTAYLPDYNPDDMIVHVSVGGWEQTFNFEDLVQTPVVYEYSFTVDNIVPIAPDKLTVKSKVNISAPWLLLGCAKFHVSVECPLSNAIDGLSSARGGTTLDHFPTTNCGPCPDCTTEDEDLELVIFDQSHANNLDTACLDGSPSGFYYDKNTQPYADGKWVVHIGDSDLCYNLPTTPPAIDIDADGCAVCEGDDHYNFQSGSFPLPDYSCDIENVTPYSSSTKFYTTPATHMKTVLSRQQTNHFADWHHVHVHQCAMDAGLGNRADPTGYHFRGAENLEQTMSWLNLYGDLSTAEEVVLVGEGSGALAAMHMVDKLQTYGATTTKWSVLTLGGLYSPPGPDFCRYNDHYITHSRQLDWTDGTCSQNARESFVEDMWGAKDSLNLECVDKSGPNWASCLLASRVLEFLPVRSMSVSNIFDSDVIQAAGGLINDVELKVVVPNALRDFVRMVGHQLEGMFSPTYAKSPDVSFALTNCMDDASNIDFDCATGVEVIESSNNYCIADLVSSWYVGEHVTKIDSSYTSNRDGFPVPEDDQRTACSAAPSWLTAIMP